MKLLIPQETLQQKLEQRVQSRREKGRFLNRRDGAALLLAIGCLLLGAVICFAPLRQKDYAPVGSFSAAAQAEPIHINTASRFAACRASAAKRRSAFWRISAKMGRTKPLPRWRACRAFPKP